MIELDGLIEFRSRFDITSLIGKCKAKAIIFFVAGTNVDCFFEFIDCFFIPLLSGEHPAPSIIVVVCGMFRVFVDGLVISVQISERKAPATVELAVFRIYVAGFLVLPDSLVISFPIGEHTSSVVISAASIIRIKIYSRQWAGTRDNGVVDAAPCPFFYALWRLLKGP